MKHLLLERCSLGHRSQCLLPSASSYVDQQLRGSKGQAVGLGGQVSNPHLSYTLQLHLTLSHISSKLTQRIINQIINKIKRH